MEKFLSFFKNLDTKYWVLILLILVVIVLIVVYYKNKNKDIKEYEPELPTKFPLRKGSSGEEVIRLQQYILSKNPGLLPKYGADGIWGNETESAVFSIFGKNEITEQDYKTLGVVIK